MSKKTRKKTGKPSAAKTRPGSKAPAKRAASKTERPSAKKSSKNERTILPEQTIVLENVENSTHLTKNQDTRALFFHACE